MATVHLEPVTDDDRRSHGWRLHLRPNAATTAAAAPRDGAAAEGGTTDNASVRRYVVPSSGAPAVSSWATPAAVVFPPVLQRPASGSYAASESQVRVARAAAPPDEATSEGVVSYVLMNAVAVAPSPAALHSTSGGDNAAADRTAQDDVYRLCRLCDVQLEPTLPGGATWSCDFCCVDIPGVFGAFECPVCAFRMCTSCVAYLDAA
jgi:hypothetical protein